MEIWQIISASGISPFSFCPTGLKSTHGFTRVCLWRESINTSKHWSRVRMLLYWWIGSELKSPSTPKLDVCVCGAGRGALPQSWMDQTLALQCSVLLHYLPVLHFRIMLTPTDIFLGIYGIMSPRTNFKQTCRHCIHKHPALFHQMIVCRWIKWHNSGCWKQNADTDLKLSKQATLPL